MQLEKVSSILLLGFFLVWCSYNFHTIIQYCICMAVAIDSATVLSRVCSCCRTTGLVPGTPEHKNVVRQEVQAVHCLHDVCDVSCHCWHSGNRIREFVFNIGVCNKEVPLNALYPSVILLHFLFRKQRHKSS